MTITLARFDVEVNPLSDQYAYVPPVVIRTVAANPIYLRDPADLVPTLTFLARGYLAFLGFEAGGGGEDVVVTVDLDADGNGTGQVAADPWRLDLVITRGADVEATVLEPPDGG